MRTPSWGVQQKFAYLVAITYAQHDFHISFEDIRAAIALYAALQRHTWNVVTQVHVLGEISQIQREPPVIPVIICEKVEAGLRIVAQDVAVQLLDGLCCAGCRPNAFARPDKAAAKRKAIVHCIGRPQGKLVRNLIDQRVANGA